jgi:hypothetical protein
VLLYPKTLNPMAKVDCFRASMLWSSGQVHRQLADKVPHWLALMDKECMRPILYSAARKGCSLQVRQFCCRVLGVVARGRGVICLQSLSHCFSADLMLVTEHLIAHAVADAILRGPSNLYQRCYLYE